MQSMGRRTGAGVTPHTPHWFFAPPLRPDLGLARDVPGANRPGARRSWWRQPWFRAAACLALFAVLSGVGPVVVAVVAGPAAVGVGGPMAVVLAVIALLVGLFGALVLERRRPPVEWSPRRFGGLGVGLAMGATLMLATFAVVWLLGGYAVHGIGTADDGYDYVTMILLLGVQAGVAEEVLFRWMLFRFTEEVVGTWLAMVVSAAVFGLVHVTNPDGTVLGAVAIMLEAGVLFALVYALTRSMWVVIGLHAAWNVVQGPVLGVPVSGAVRGGLLETTAHGPVWLSGGDFGAESTVAAVVLCLAVSVWAGWQLRRRALVVAPVWVRRRRVRQGARVAS